MARVSEILAAKGGAVRCTTPESTAHSAIAEMVQCGVGSLLVLDGREVVGIFTERDYLRSVVMQDRDGRTTRVGDLMTRRVVCVEPTRTVEDCMAIMTQERFRHLPVVEGDELVGVISIGDLVKYLSREREVELQYLTEYITGRY